MPLTVLYAQQGPIMYRIGGSTESPDGDPTADVLAVAGEIISGQAGGELMVFNRENAIGLVLFSSVGLWPWSSSSASPRGTRFRFEGPPWLGTALVILFIAGTIYGFLIRPGRRWSWPWSKDTDQDRRDRL